MILEEELRLQCVLTMEEVLEEEVVVIEQTATNEMFLQETNTKEKNLDVFQVSLDHLTEKNGRELKAINT